MNILKQDAGMFPNRPYLRLLPHHSLLELLIATPSDFIEQTAIVKLLENLVIDPTHSAAFAPFPISSEEFQRFYSQTESVELPDKVFFCYNALQQAFTSGVLPEAKDEEQLHILQAQVKPREVTQWWLVANPRYREFIDQEDIPHLIDESQTCMWVATYDVMLKNDFLDTSIGRCLTIAEREHTGCLI